MSEPLLSFGELSAGWPGRGRKSAKRCLSGASGYLEPGELVLLLGANGSGKSTLLRTLAGLIPPLSGRIRLAGRELESLTPSAQARLRALVSGSWESHGPVSLGEFTALGRIPWGRGNSALDKEAVAGALAAVGLSGRETERIDRLSDGERQKGKLARALCQETPLIFLDEPDSHLDLRARGDLWHLLETLIREGGKTILCVTHDPGTLNLADRIWLAEQDTLSVFGKGELTEGELRRRI